MSTNCATRAQSKEEYLAGAKLVASYADALVKAIEADDLAAHFIAAQGLYWSYKYLGVSDPDSRV